MLVTGAGRGIGRGIALACANSGAAVALTGRSVRALEHVAEEIRNSGGTAVVSTCDISEHGDVEAMTADVSARLGPIDVLCANSGVPGPTAPLWQITPREWAETFSVNVDGTFFCCRALLPGMIERRSGSIVIVGSMSGKKPLANRTAYAASKMALVGLTRSLAAEVGPHAVRVNLVSPGPVAGTRLERVIEAQAAATGASTEEARGRFLAGTVLNRFVEAADVAAAVVFLASDRARSITGEDLNVSAGSAMY